MTQAEDDILKLNGMIEDLESSISGAQSMTSAFRTEMEDVTSTMRTASNDAKGLSRSLGSNLKTAFKDLIFDGARLSDVLKGAGRGVANSAFNAAFKPVQDAFGGAVTTGLSSLFGGMFAKGGAFSQGQVVPFARGGIVRGPTTFPMRGGTGLMGEAGPEAIMPLTRGPDGSLGVRTSGGGGVNVTMNVATNDATSFQRSRGQIAAQMNRALSRGRRNL